MCSVGHSGGFDQSFLREINFGGLLGATDFDSSNASASSPGEQALRDG